VRAALRSQAQASSSPFAGGTAMAGRAAKEKKKPGAPPAGGRRGQVELLAHAYATCDVMSGLDKGP
jgi:hypothetical protein